MPENTKIWVVGSGCRYRVFRALDPHPNIQKAQYAHIHPNLRVLVGFGQFGNGKAQWRSVILKKGALASPNKD